MEKKKQTQIHITIPEPCHERWDKMTPTEKGAYCQSCSKEVMDFTALPQEDIAYYFKHKTNGNTCGRFKPAQLQQTYIFPPDAAQKRSWMRAIWLLPLTLLGKNLFGQQKPPVCEKPQTETQAPAVIDTTIKTQGHGDVLTGDTILVVQEQQTKILQGRVRNAETQAALPLAVVKVNDTLQAFADSKGNFVLELPEGFVTDSFVVTLDGFSGKFISLKNDSTTAFREIELQPLFVWDPAASLVLWESQTFVYGGPMVTLGDVCVIPEMSTVGFTSIVTLPENEKMEAVVKNLPAINPDNFPKTDVSRNDSPAEVLKEKPNQPLPAAPQVPKQPNENNKQAILPPAIGTRKKK